MAKVQFKLVLRITSRGTLSEITETPCLPASSTPAGDCTDATATGRVGFW